MDATLASTKHRSSVSRFKSERTAQYLASNPAPADPFLAAEVRHGKVVDGELIAGLDDDSSEDEDGLNQNARRIIAELMGKSPEEAQTSNGHSLQHVNCNRSLDLYSSPCA